MKALIAAVLALTAQLYAAEPVAAVRTPAEELADNTIVGLVRLCRALDAAGTQRLEFDAAARDALIGGMPRRIRPFLSRLDANGRAIEVVAAEIRPHPTLAGRRQVMVTFSGDRIAPSADRSSRFGGAQVKGHVGDIWLSRARVVCATINTTAISDPRATSAPAYAICQQQHAILSEDATAKPLAAHPWTMPGQTTPIGLEDITGLALQIRVSGWWKDATDIQPVSHLFVHTDAPEAHIWLGYKELVGHLDRKALRFQCSNAAFDAGLPATAAFPDYLGLAPMAQDKFSVCDLTAEGK